MQEKILKAMAGCDSKSPISVAKISESIDEYIPDIENQLSAMYERGMVNKAYVQNSIHTGNVYWPTGINKPLVIKDTKPAPVRRDEVPVFLQDNKAEERPTVTVKAFNYISDNEGCSTAQLDNFLGIVGAQNWIKHLVKTGKVIKLKGPIGKNIRYFTAAGYQKHLENTDKAAEQKPVPLPASKPAKFTGLDNSLKKAYETVIAKEHKELTAMELIHKLMYLMPNQCDLTISKGEISDTQEKVFINTSTLDKEMNIKISKINEFFSALNTINESMASE